MWKGKFRLEAQDVTDPSIEAELVTRKLGQTSSNMDVDTQVTTQAFSKDEIVKEEEDAIETNTKEIERIKLGSNKFCIRNDLAKKTNDAWKPTW